MPITPLDAITFANQNMQVPASKQNDYRNRIEQQSYAAVAKMAQKETSVAGVDDLKEDQKIDNEREHNREEAEEQTGEKDKETRVAKELKEKAETKKAEDDELPYRILDIKV